MAINAEAVCFPFSETGHKVGGLPYLPLILSYHGGSFAICGLLDTGASVNVLPYEIGIELGAIWEQHTTRVRLTGNLANYEARAIIVSATVSSFTPVNLVFAWTEMKHIPLILGQMNFFTEFDVCFFASQSFFEIAPKHKTYKYPI